MTVFRIFLAFLGFSLAVPGYGKSDEITETITAFIQQQTAAYAGEVKFTIGSTEGSRKLPICNGYQAFFPNAGQTLGNTTIGVRCLMPNNWTIYVPVKIQISGSYLLSAHALAAGQTLSAADLSETKGDLASLPPGILQKREQAIGKTVRFALAAGQPLRAEHLTPPILVRQNQSVRLTVGGPGFKASAEGKSLSNGAEGQSIQVRTPSGSTISGIVQADGTVLIPYTP